MLVDARRNDMKPFWHTALEPDIPARPRMRPAWTSWMLVGVMILIAGGVAYSFWASTTPYAPERSLDH